MLFSISFHPSLRPETLPENFCQSLGLVKIIVKVIAEAKEAHLPACFGVGVFCHCSFEPW
jgi:hypothetical protein